MPKTLKLKPLRGKGKSASGKLKTLRAVRANIGLEVAYRKKLQAMIDQIHRSAIWHIRAAYRKNPPRIAQDATPFDFMRRLIHQLRTRWLKQIDETAPKLAAHFDQSVANRSDAALKKILRDGGFSVKWQWTAGMRDISAASIQGNVSLIKSIPARYFDQIETIIAQGYSNGYDLKRVTDDLQHQFKVSRKRASFIARDQSSKLSSQYTRARHRELGIETGIWRHSHGGRHPRKSHQEMDGKKFKLSEGMFDREINKNTWPGIEINCRCTYSPVVPGFS